MKNEHRQVQHGISDSDRASNRAYKVVNRGGGVGILPGTRRLMLRDMRHVIAPHPKQRT